MMIVTNKTASAASTCRSFARYAVRQQQSAAHRSNSHLALMPQRVFILRLSGDSSGRVNNQTSLRLFRSQRKPPVALAEEEQAARFAEIQPKNRPKPETPLDLSAKAEEALHANAMKNYSKWDTIGKPLIFTVGTSVLAFTGAAIWRYEESDTATQMLRNRLRQAYQKKDYSKRYDVRDRLIHGWSFLSPAEKALISIIALNVAVYGAWLALPSSLMFRYFVSSTYQAPFSIPLLLSSISHKNLLHLGANMYVLWNFGPLLLNSVAGMDNQQNLLAFFVAGGVVSAFASHWLRLVRKIPSSSLGASGAICAALAAVAVANPDTRVAIIGLSDCPFSIQDGLKAMVLIEVIGIWRKWRIFDHAGHLSGLLFGIAYAARGHRWIAKYQEFVVRQWIKFYHGGVPKI